MLPITEICSSRTFLFWLAACQMAVSLILLLNDNSVQYRVSFFVPKGSLRGDNKNPDHLTYTWSTLGETNITAAQETLLVDKKLYNKTKSINVILRKSAEISTVNRITETITCGDLINGSVPSNATINSALNALRTAITPDSEFINMTRDCRKFVRDRGYFDMPVTQDERDFPLAFTILVYKSVHQVEQLLRTIYRPHNSYCIHIDAKSPPEFHVAMESISHCFNNVFIASRLENVIWGTISIVKAERRCQKDLLATGRKWKYLINLTGQEFPLRTNLELVQVLKQFNGQNDIRTLATPVQNWTYYRHEVVDGQLHQTDILKTDPRPSNLTVHKGTLFSALSRPFVRFLQSEIAEQWLLWFSDTKNPDESFTQTLASHPDAPGGPGPIGSKAVMSRDIVWSSAKAPRVCYGKFVRSVCVHSWRDLPWLSHSNRLFANKFHVDYDELVLKCLEEMIHNRTLNPPDLDFNRYRRFLKFRIGPPKSPK